MPGAIKHKTKYRYDDTVDRIISKIFNPPGNNDQLYNQTSQHDRFQYGWQEEYKKKKLLECNSCLRKLRIQRAFDILQENRIMQIRRKQALSIASQFHDYVVLLKHFDKWFEFSNRRREALRSSWQVMRKILIKWRLHAEEQRQQRIAVILMDKNVKCLQSRVLRCALEIWSKRCWRIRFSSRLFTGWRLIASRSSIEQKRTMDRLELNLKREVLAQWRDVSIVQIYSRRKHQFDKRRVFIMWKRRSEESVLKWKLAIRNAESFSEEISFKRVGRIFDYMSDHAIRKRKVRNAYIHVASNYRCRLVREAMRQWVKYKTFEKEKRRILYRIISRRLLMEWYHFVTLERNNEIIFTKIILNRWRIFAEDRIERRSIAWKAVKHWARCLCRLVVRSWKEVVVRERGRIRTPLRRHRYRTASSANLGTLPRVQYPEYRRQTSPRIGTYRRDKAIKSINLSPVRRKIRFDESSGTNRRRDRRRYDRHDDDFANERTRYGRSLIQNHGGEFANERTRYGRSLVQNHVQEFSKLNAESMKRTRSNYLEMGRFGIDATRQTPEKIIDVLPTPPSTTLPTWVSRALSERGRIYPPKSTNESSSATNVARFRAESKLSSPPRPSSEVKSRFLEKDAKLRNALASYCNDAK